MSTCSGRGEKGKDEKGQNRKEERLKGGPSFYHIKRVKCCSTQTSRHMSSIEGLHEGRG